MPTYRHDFFKTCTCALLLWSCHELHVEAIAPSFLVPTASTQPRTVNENSPKDVSILTVEGQDGDGDRLIFYISIQVPVSPPFELESNTGLFKTPNGLDAKTTQSFNFTFGVSDGTTTVDSVMFTVYINDVNDNIPQFVGEPYSASILDSVGDSAVVFTVSATDADVTPATISYSIIGGNTNGTFAILMNGQIIVATSANLNGASVYNLFVQASDGSNTGIATVTITVAADFCYDDPCVNGVCINENINYNCSCSPGFLGVNCSKVDYCFGDPCVNGACRNENNFFICACTAGYVGVACSNECRNGTFGFGCNEECGKCLDGETCDKRTGTCDECEPGYIAPLCKMLKNPEHETPCPEVKIYHIVTALLGTVAVVSIIGFVVAVYFVIRRRGNDRSKPGRRLQDVSGPYDLADRSSYQTEHQYELPTPADRSFEEPVIPYQNVV